MYILKSKKIHFHISFHKIFGIKIVYNDKHISSGNKKS